MKKYFFILCFLMPIILLAQTKVAVYVVESSVDSSIRKIIGSEMVSAIVVNKDYQAVERTSVFLEQISKEQNYQQNDDSQISWIGQNIGVDFVCVLDVTLYSSSYYIQARLLDVNQAIVLSTAREISSLSNISEIVTVTESIASHLIGENSVSQQCPTEYSIYETKNDYGLDLISIDNTGSFTIVTFKYCTPKDTKICIKTDAYLRDNKTYKQYKLVDASNISFSPSMKNISEGIWEFSLTFEKLDTSINDIAFIEPEGWGIYSISLKPFGKKNYHKFIDYSESDYQALVSSYKSSLQKDAYAAQQNAKQQEVIGNAIGNLMETLFTYKFHVVNTKIFKRYIFINNKMIGIVNGNSEATFNLDSSYKGPVKAVQADGYIISPSVETFYIDKAYGGQTIHWTIK